MVILNQAGREIVKLELFKQVIRPITHWGPEDVDIKGIAYDSRQIRPGYLFVALPGSRVDGTEFIDEAIARGAVAVVSTIPDWNRRDVAHFQVEDSRRALAEIAGMFFDYPSAKLQVLGITGTNGKTTTSFMARAILSEANRKPGLIGTVRYEVGQRVIPAGRTTPEAPELQSLLSSMVSSGCEAVVMEVSSHALSQNRVWGIDCDVGIFTNLSQDHLDSHGSMEAYFEAKASLFRRLGHFQKKGFAVINIDDEWGKKLAERSDIKATILTYGQDTEADVRAENVEVTAVGSSFIVHTPWGRDHVHLNLLGNFNVSNALAAIAACGVMGVDPRTMVEVLGGLNAIPGRLEPVSNGKGLRVYVDYAHTHDALQNVLSMLRQVSAGGLLLVFGCGGDRDKGKRQRMGRVAAAWADYTVLTNDNPRREDPEVIIRQIEEGFGEKTNREVELDRERAIARALSLAEAGDCVVIAGKGHENYQEFADTVIPFDDHEVADRILNRS